MIVHCRADPITVSNAYILLYGKRLLRATLPFMITKGDSAGQRALAVRYASRYYSFNPDTIASGSMAYCASCIQSVHIEY